MTPSIFCLINTHLCISNPLKQGHWQLHCPSHLLHSALLCGVHPVDPVVSTMLCIVSMVDTLAMCFSVLQWANSTWDPLVE